MQSFEMVLKFDDFYSPAWQFDGERLICHRGLARLFEFPAHEVSEIVLCISSQHCPDAHELVLLDRDLYLVAGSMLKELDFTLTHSQHKEFQRVAAQGTGVWLTMWY